MRNKRRRVEIEIIPEDARRYLRGDIDDEEYYSHAASAGRQDEGFLAGKRDYREAQKAEAAPASQ